VVHVIFSVSAGKDQQRLFIEASLSFPEGDVSMGGLSIDYNHHYHPDGKKGICKDFQGTLHYSNMTTPVPQS
jgi:hypothetical protein